MGRKGAKSLRNEAKLGWEGADLGGRNWQKEALQLFTALDVVQVCVKGVCILVCVRRGPRASEGSTDNEHTSIEEIIKVHSPVTGDKCCFCPECVLFLPDACAYIRLHFVACTSNSFALHFTLACIALHAL